MERFVLGVDAAWTEHEPSGIVLLKWHGSPKGRIVRAGRSYGEFCSIGTPSWQDPAKGSSPDFVAVLQTCKNAGYTAVDTVTLDIPLSPVEIVGRREADNAISRHYGKRGAGTHSPTPGRPGAIASAIFDQLTECGFGWAGKQPLNQPTFIEVYPHVAILELFGYPYRFQYKVQKRNRYWPNLSAAKRRENIVKNLLELRDRLSAEITNVADFLPDIDERWPTKFLKNYEDLIDATICALVAVSFLKGEALPFGDETSVIWVPNSREPVELAR